MANIEALAKFNEEAMRQTLEMVRDHYNGRVSVDGLSFKVYKPTLHDYFRGPRTFDRPFTKREYRADRWRTSKARWKRRITSPYRTVKHRAPLVWDALRGVEHGDWY